MTDLSPEIARAWAFMLSEKDAYERAMKDVEAAKQRAIKHLAAVRLHSDAIKALCEGEAA